MKKLLYLLIFLLILFVAAAFIVPVVLKKPIIKAVKEQAAQQLNATIDFKNVDISLIWSFPDLYVGVDEFYLKGKGEFDGITLLYLHRIELDVDLMSAFKGSPVINEVNLAEGLANMLVLENGNANYDILPETEDEDQQAPPAQTDKGFNISLKKFNISDVEVAYTDKQSGTEFSTEALNLSLAGDFSSVNTVLETSVNMKQVVLKQGSVKYLNGVEMDLKAKVDADMQQNNYQLIDNELRINGLHLALNGGFSMPDSSDMAIDMSYAASKTDFKEILSLVPTVYKNDFDGLEASGSLELNGIVKGTVGEGHIPGFTANLKVANGRIKYPDLPKSIDGINIDLEAAGTGGDADNIVVNLKRLVFQIGENPFDVHARISTPVSDPNVDATLKGKIDLASLSEAMPLEEGEALSGTLIADVTLKGRQSDIEKKRYGRVEAKGELIIMDMQYHSPAVKVPVMLKYAQLKFNPKYLELASFDARAGRSDFKLKGRITDYFSYMMSDGTLKGSFNLNSTLIDGNELAGLNIAKTDASANDAPQSDGPDTTQPFKIPDNLDLALATNITKVSYDNITLLNVKGNVSVRNGKADLKGLTFNTLGGSVNMSGYYDSRHVEEPKVRYDLKLNDIVVKDAFASFGSVRKLAPIFEKTEGRASITMDVAGSMKSGTALDYNSLNGSGRLTSQRLTIKGTKALSKVAEVVKIKELKNPELKNVNLSFKFLDGRVHVQPFDVKIGPVSATIFGNHGFDETLDYVMSTSVPTSVLGGQANSVINGLVSQANALGTNFTVGKTIDVDILIKGTFSNPKVTPSFKGSGSGKSASDNLKAQAEAELKKQQQELEQKARDEAARLQHEAEARARQEADRLKKQAEERARKEAGNVLNGLFGKPK